MSAVVGLWVAFWRTQPYPFLLPHFSFFTPICDEPDFVRRWAVAGHGIALKSALDLVDDLHTGRLTTLLIHYETEPLKLWLVCPARSQVSPAVRIIRESLRAFCQQLSERVKVAL